jgi:pSer/pThr/pTyr-binding forkhead associated (FHA) protein
MRLDRELPPLPTESRWLVTGGRCIALTQGENAIGRDPVAVVCLDVAGVSRRHAGIVIGEGGAVLDDLGSKNGTMLADQPVTDGVVLGDGDQIQVGPVLIIFHASASGLPTVTLPGFTPGEDGASRTRPRTITARHGGHRRPPALRVSAVWLLAPPPEFPEILPTPPLT